MMGHPSSAKCSMNDAKEEDKMYTYPGTNVCLSSLICTGKYMAPAWGPCSTIFRVASGGRFPCAGPAKGSKPGFAQDNGPAFEMDAEAEVEVEIVGQDCAASQGMRNIFEGGCLPATHAANAHKAVPGSLYSTGGCSVATGACSSRTGRASCSWEP